MNYRLPPAAISFAIAPAILWAANSAQTLGQTASLGSLGRVVTLADGDQSAADLQAMQSIQELISELDHPSYQHRQKSSQQIFRLAMESNESSSRMIQQALQHGLSDRSIELRWQCYRLLNRIDHQQIELRLEHLTDPTVRAESISLPFWHEFNDAVGDNPAARNFFSMMIRRHHRMAMLAERKLIPSSRSGNAPTGQILDHPVTGIYGIPFTDEARQAILLQAPRLAVLQTAKKDIHRWAALILLDQSYAQKRDHEIRVNVEHAAQALPQIHNRMPYESLAARLTASFVNQSSGPFWECRSRLQDQGPESRILSQLVLRWLDCRQEAMSDRERLIILFRFGLLENASNLAQQISGNDHPCPHASVTALAVSCLLSPKEGESQARRLMGDHRRLFSSTVIIGQNVQIETQVGDVAMAWRLRNAGVDPRQVGFDHLKSDRLWVFIPSSLGFANDRLRDRAKKATAELLGKPE